MKFKLRSTGAICALLLVASAAHAQFFTGTDLGGPAEPGSIVDNGGGSLTITGGGGDIWGNSDQCYYYYAWASGSEWVATVKCTDLQGPDNWTKAELMVRWSDPTAGPQADDGFIATMTTRALGQNQIGPQYRPARGGGAGNAGPTATPAYPNVWLRLARTNNSFTIAYSFDNVTFTTLSTIDTSSTDNGFGQAWPDLVTVGLAVTSHNNGAGQIATAAFEGLNVTFPAVTAPTVIGASVQVTNTSVYAGSEASFSFATTNNANPPVVGGSYTSYQWYKNGTAIPNATGLSYTHLVNPFDAAENGAEYYCKATILPPYNTTITGMNSATGIVTVLPGALYYTNGLKQEFFHSSGVNRALVEAGNVPPATSISRLAALDSNGGLGDNYVTRHSGWFIPPATDNYIFFLACDDDTDLFLSTDNNPAHKQLIAQETSWAGTRSWLTSSGDGTLTRSDTFTPDNGITVPGANGYALTAGTPYYIEMVHHNGGGGDNFGVTYQTYNQVYNDPNWPLVFTNGVPSLMTNGLVLLTPPTTTLTWATQPTDSSAYQGDSTTFYSSASTDSEMVPTYQWYRNGAPVAGATGPTLNTGLTTPANNGDTFYVVAATQEGGLSITSSPTATLTVITAVLEKGWAKVEFWAGSDKDKIQAGTAGSPTYITTSPAFEASVNNETGDSYGRRISGFFIPPTSDKYVFFVNSDDNSDLYLGTDDTPATKRLIAQETAWSDPWHWLSSGGGSSLTQKRSDGWSPDGGTTIPNAAGISLTAGQKYYVEVVHTEGGGGDNVEVNYKRFSDPDPTDGSDTAFKGNVLAMYAPRCSWVAFTQQPTNPAPVGSSSSGTVSFYAAGATDSQTPIGITGDVRPFIGNWNYMTFQWQKNGVDIPGATGSQLTLSSPFLPSDNGAVFTCKMRALGYADDSLNPIWSNSAPATLTVITNTPNFVYSLYYTNNSYVPFVGQAYTLVTVAFDSAMDPGLLSQPSTYVLGGGLTIDSVTVNSNDYRSVQLKVSGTPTFPFNVTINGNVSGLGGGAKVANTTQSVIMSQLVCEDIGATPGTDPAVPGQMFGFAPNGYNIACEGSDVWNNDDGFNFAYEMKTGDFDVVVRQVDTKHTSNWAKGGLMVRESLASNSRNWNIVNDPLASDGIQAPDSSGFGASFVECNARNTTAGASAAWDFVARPAPTYPNAWVRLARVGQEIRAYRSTDGVSWTLLATNTPALVGEMTALPATVYVGLCTTAHNNDALDPITGQLPDPLRFLQVVNYADYNSSFVPSAPRANLTATTSGGNIVISWSPAGGHLESTPGLGSATNWQPVPGGTTSPATIPIGPGTQLFRVVNP